MSVIEIPCPQCGMRLKLPDRSLLGRKGKCSKCGHKFILEEPAPAAEDEVAFQLASEASGNETLMGIGARWVPDRGGGAVPAPAPVPSPAYVAPSPGLAESSDPVVPGIPAVAESGSVLQRKRKKGNWAGLVMGAVVAIAGAWVVYYSLSSTPQPKQARKGKAVDTKAASAAGDDIPGAITELSETRAERPVDLLLVPSGAYMVVHFRPADLWASGGNLEELRAAVGPLGKWLENTLTEQCLVAPGAIEEVKFCWIPAAKGTPPGTACVVHLKEPMKKSEMLEKFNGELVDGPGRPHYRGPEKAYLIYDQKTFAICPAEMAGELVEAADNPAIAPDSVQELLLRTDRDRLCSVVFTPDAVRQDVPFLVAPNLQTFVNSMLDWFGDDVEGVAWTWTLNESQFESKVFVRNQTVITPPNLLRDLERKLKQLPFDVLEVVEQTHPTTVGFRKVMGRYPAMTQVVAKTTRLSTGQRLVALETELPERSAPNLALGTLLTWDHTQHADYGTSRAPTVAARGGGESGGESGSGTLADKLQKKITVDFRDEFLYAAIDYIGEETGAKFKIEGNDLKMVGVTQNMRQAFKMQDAPATAVLDRMLTKLGLVIVVDEEKKLVTVTSAKAAEERKLTPFPLQGGTQ